MAEQVWVVTDKSGNVLAQVMTTDPTFSPSLQGYAFNPVTMNQYKAPRRGTELETFNTTTLTWTEVPALVEDLLIGLIKSDCERRTMAIYTAMRGKMKKYAKKEQEVADWYALGPDGAVASVLGTAFNALSVTARKRKFRFALADSSAFGDTVAAAIARFESGIVATENQVASLEATEQKVTADIKAASTAAAKRAVYNAMVWPT